MGVLLYEIGELEDQYVDRYDQYRITMKSIRNIEASVQPSRERETYRAFDIYSTFHTDRSQANKKSPTRSPS